MSDRVALITGASSGLGRACAERLHAAGWTVVGTSRRAPAGLPWPMVAMDVDDDDSVAAGVARVVDEHGGIDAVLAAAGWGLAGSIERTPIAEAKAQLETNFFGVVRTVTAALPTLRERRGRVLVFSSIGGQIAIPFQAYYSASKFALEGWAEALAWEVRPYGVHVTLVQPGNFATGFTGARHVVGGEAGDPYAEAQARAIGVMERDERNGADPADLAAAVDKLLAADRPPLRLSVGPFDERLGMLAKRVLPYRVFEALAARSLGV